MRLIDIGNKCFRNLNAFRILHYRGEYLAFRNMRLYRVEYSIVEKFRELLFTGKIEYNKKFRDRYGISVYDNTVYCIYNLNI